MKNFIEKQKEFLAKSTELLKEEKFEEVIKNFEENSKIISEIETNILKEEEEKEKVEKEAEEEVEEKEEEKEEEKSEEEIEKEQINKYAELFASASSVSELISDLWDVKSLLKKQEETIEELKKFSKGSSQPEENIKKSETDNSMSALWNALLW